MSCTHLYPLQTTYFWILIIFHFILFYFRCHVITWSHAELTEHLPSLPKSYRWQITQFPTPADISKAFSALFPFITVNLHYLTATEITYHYQTLSEPTEIIPMTNHTFPIIIWSSILHHQSSSRPASNSGACLKVASCIIYHFHLPFMFLSFLFPFISPPLETSIKPSVD